MVLLPWLALRQMWTSIFGLTTSCLLLILAGGWLFSFGAYRAYIEAVDVDATIIPLYHSLRFFSGAHGARLGRSRDDSNVAIADLLVVAGLPANGARVLHGV